MQENSDGWFLSDFYVSSWYWNSDSSNLSHVSKSSIRYPTRKKNQDQNEFSTEVTNVFCNDSESNFDSNFIRHVCHSSGSFTLTNVEPRTFEGQKKNSHPHSLSRSAGDSDEQPPQLRAHCVSKLSRRRACLYFPRGPMKNSPS